jgi:fibronectin type 3 domain-containing protein
MTRVDVPAAPTGVTVMPLSSSSISISWNPVSGASAYSVYRAPSLNGPYNFLNNTTDPFYTDMGLSPSTTYHYEVCAWNSAGEGSRSYTSATTLAGEPAFIPVTNITGGFNTTVVAGQPLSLSGTVEPANATNKTIVWSVWSGTGAYLSGNNLITSAAGTVTVRATIAGGSTWGDYTQDFYIDVAPPAPVAPGWVSATVLSSSSISVSWDQVSGADLYYIYRAASPDGDYDLIGRSSTSSYTDEYLLPSTMYYYKVSALNSEGESDRSSYTSVATLAAQPTVPAAPTGVTATTQSSSSIFVSWDHVSGASGYYVYRSTSFSSGYVRISSLVSGTSYPDTGLSPGTYYYKVSAWNGAEESSQSSSYGYATISAATTTAQVTITVGFNGAITITSDAVNNVIYKSGSPDSITFTATGYTDIGWYVDGGSKQTGSSLTKNATDLHTGTHSVTFTGYKDGAPWSKAIPFTVLD